jgi:hypothetical protein
MEWLWSDRFACSGLFALWRGSRMPTGVVGGYRVICMPFGFLFLGCVRDCPIW